MITAKKINEWRFLTFETLRNTTLFEDNEVFDNERQKVINKIQNNDFEINNPRAFYNAAQKTQRKSMLTDYSIQDFEDMTTYLLNGYNVGYAIKKDGDIVSVFNNSGVPNIGDELIKSAIKNNGHKLDHFDGYLSDFYEKAGFKEVDRYKWDDQYAPQNWDYDKYGKPDIVMRSYQPTN